MNTIRFLVLVVVTTLYLAVVACGSDSQDSTSGYASMAARATAAARSEVTQPSCDTTPSQTEGPYYFDVGKVRRDITEGKPGTPLLVTLHLVEAGSCAPIRDAVVDIWHTDAAGLYSGFRGQVGDGVDTSGETFLRGTQITDADGLAEFETIYPGWYPGRTVHIHFKVYTSERTLVTSQMYFPDDVTDAVYLSEPYSARGPRRTTNESDRLPNDDSEYRTLLGQVTQDGDGFLVSLTIGVVR